MSIPRDLVTVIRESAATMQEHQPLGHKPGKAAAGAELSARKPARCRVRGLNAPNHEELVVPQGTCLKAEVFLCCHSARKRPRFLFGLVWVCAASSAMAVLERKQNP